MVTIANANFPDSDHEDEDFEVPGGIDEPADTGAEPSSERRRRRKRHKSTDDLWKEMQQDEMESAKSWIKRPCPDPGLFRSFQRRSLRHETKDSPQKPNAILAEVAKYSPVAIEGQEQPTAKEMKHKARDGTTTLTIRGSSRISRKEMLQEVSKYCGSADGSEIPSAAEMKKKVRFSREALSTSGASTETKMLKATIVQESVRFAGQTLTIERRLVPGSVEEKRYLQSQKRRNSAKLGGGLTALDKLLGISRDKELNTVEKSGLDWHRHKEEAGVGTQCSFATIFGSNT
ncbi:unnamed protein product [Cladocopium goreaui]|uniref:BCNT-C domain-containing protein n=1 Tax=Cladocopium goreaui TaxID=2562237 RepID=A0A9P1FIR9_9DINO|nr:unnamed protein product [Cladocopium goreaui]